MRVLRLIPAVAFVLALGASPVTAADTRPGAVAGGTDQVSRGAAMLLSRLGGLLASLWSSSADAGCWIDPLGGCAATREDTDAGCIMDPWGRCLSSSATGDAGCIMDPLGRCLSSSSTGDEGCIMDPWGRCRTTP